MVKLGFPKSEKMTLRSDIDRIMSSTSSVYGKGMTIKYLKLERADAPFKILVIAPKKRFRLAVRRNRIKRQLREIFRTNKEKFKNLDFDKDCLHMAIIYSGPEKMNYRQTEDLFKGLIVKMDRSLT